MMAVAMTAGGIAPAHATGAAATPQSEAETAIPAKSGTTSSAEIVRTIAPEDVQLAPQGTFPRPAAAAEEPARILVQVGGDRTSDTSFGSLAGVELFLNTGYSAPSGTRPDRVPGSGDGWAKCVSDAAGICLFLVPAAGLGGANRDARFWVVPGSAPPGWFTNPSMRTGTVAVPSAYAFRTGFTLRSGATYSSTRDFMFDPLDTPAASDGTWQVSRHNPKIPDGCPVNVALVVDTSGSVAGQMPQLLGALDTVVDGVTGTGSKLSLFSFASTSPAARNGQNTPTLQPVSTPAQADAFKARYRPWVAEGGTNWDRGIAKAAEASTGNNRYDMAVFITDGTPTLYGWQPNGNGRSTRFTELEHAVFSANQLKAQGTRVLAVGVGNDISGSVNGLDLRAISGPEAGSDYLQTADYATAAAQIRDRLLSGCKSSLRLTTMLVPETAPAGSIAGAVPAGSGWASTARDPGAGLVVQAPATRTTSADGTGAVDFSFSLPRADTSESSVTIATSPTPGFTPVSVNGKNAVCRLPGTGAEVAVTNVGSDAFRAGVGRSAPVACMTYFRAPSTAATVAVDASWVIEDADGKEISRFKNPGPDSGLPAGITGALRLSGPGNAGESPQPWGQPRGGYSAGNTVRIAEDVSVDRAALPGCVIRSQRLTRANGSTADAGLPADRTLVGGANVFEITNIVRCEQTLELRTFVENGVASPADWTVFARATAADTRPGPNGAYTGPGTVRASVTAGAAYALGAQGSPAASAYVQHGPWVCIKDGNGAPLSPDIGSRITVPIGQNTICTVRNATAEVTVFVDVPDGKQPSSRWSVEGTPAEGVPGLGAVRWVGTRSGSPGGNGDPVASLRPDHRYTLSERVPDGASLAYLTREVQRWDGRAWVDMPRGADGSVEIRAPIGTRSYFRLINRLAPAVAIPFTGGLGTDAILAIGAAAAIAAIRLGARRRPRERAPVAAHSHHSTSTADQAL